MRQSLRPLPTAALLSLIAACGGSEAEPDPGSASSPGESPPAEAAAEEDHEHAETALGTFEIGGLPIELAQGHGVVTAGKESHLVVKLPFNDGGSTVVRAWIGSADRTLSRVGKGEYAPSHDDYDVHATAPDPLPPGALWWVEIERPDGTILIGSAPPLLD